MASKATAKPVKKRGRPVGSKGKKKIVPSTGKGSAPLPPPVEINAQPLEEKSGLLSGVRNLLQPKPAVATASPESVDSYAPSSISEGAISEESARLLAAVPESIGGGPEDALPGAIDGAQGEEDPIAALMAQVAFEPQDVQDVLTEFFDWLAERAESEHWKLTERQGRMLGRPLAQMLNSCWLKLQSFLPDVLGRWCESTPGALAFLMAAGLVIGPKLGKQLAISKAKRKAVPMVKDRPAAPAPAAAPLPPRPAGGGIVFESAA